MVLFLPPARLFLWIIAVCKERVMYWIILLVLGVLGLFSVASGVTMVVVGDYGTLAFNVFSLIMVGLIVFDLELCRRG